MTTDVRTKLDEYRARAADALAAGAEAPLDHVRAKHETSARVWTELAEAEESRLNDRARRLASLPAT